MTSRTEFRTFGQLALAGALVAALIAGGQYFVESIGRVGAEREARTLLAIASTAAAAVEPDKVAALAGSVEPAGAAAHCDIGDELKRLRGAPQNARSVYLVARNGDSLTVLVASNSLALQAGQPPVRIQGEAAAKLSGVYK